LKFLSTEEVQRGWVRKRGKEDRKGAFGVGCYRGADKSLARPGRKQANVSFRMACNSFGALLCRKKNLDERSRVDVVEIARVPDMLPRLFPSWSG